MPTDRGRGPGGTRWWWLVVAALALVVVALLVRGGGEDDGAVPTTAPETPSLEPADPGSDADEGSMTVGGEDVLRAGGDGDLGGHVGEEVVGDRVPVASAVAEGMFWVGDADGAAFLVVTDGTGPALTPGDAVSFRGTIRRLDDEIRGAVSGADATRLERQGAYVEVEELERMRRRS
jgi:hypothetical protein